MREKSAKIPVVTGNPSTPIYLLAMSHDNVGLWILRAFCAWYRDWADFACQDGRRVPGLRPLIVVRDRTAQRWRRLVLMSGAGSLWGAHMGMHKPGSDTSVEGKLDPNHEEQAERRHGYTNGKERWGEGRRGGGETDTATEVERERERGREREPHTPPEEKRGGKKPRNRTCWK